MIYVQQQQVRNRKEPLIPKQTDEMIEVLNIVGDITNVMTLDHERFVEVTSSASSSSSDSGSEVRPRKRAKLDHLSADEKAQHRKMMNRISAQSARDRQKTLMQIQEVQIVNLTSTNEALKKDNETLKTKCESLTTENERLSNLAKEYEAKIKILESFGAMKVEVKSEKLDNTEEEKEGNGIHSSLEPAVPRTVPLPKGPELMKNFSLILLLWTCFQWILTHPSSSKPSMTSLSKYLAQEISSQADSKLPSLQKKMLLQLMPLLKSIRLKDPG